MTDIAEVYLRIDIFEATEANVSRYGKRIEQFAYAAARETYRFDVAIEIYLEPGSLRGWATIVLAGLGAVYVAYGAIATYPDFKQGLAELFDDAKEYGRFVVERVETEAEPLSPVYSQKRTKTPGRILRSLDRLERLEHNLKRLSPEEINQELNIVRRGLKLGLEDLPPLEADKIESVIREYHSGRLPNRLMPLLFAREPRPRSTQALHTVRDREEAPAPLTYYSSRHTGDPGYQLPRPTRREVARRWRAGDSEF